MLSCKGVCFLLFFLLLSFSLRCEGSSCDEVCLDSDHHKEKPAPEDELFDVCSPWKSRSCCTTNTSYEAHVEGGENTYGFVFSHCSDIKPMSEKCKKHFIEDNCFYECSPNVGPWLVDEGNSYRNQRYRDIPLCLGECMDWWEDCKDDYTCKDNWSVGWDWSEGYNKCPQPQNTSCKPFKEVFPTAEAICDIYPGDFIVTPDDEPCMVMWFPPGSENPNDEVSKYYMDKGIGKTCSGSSSNHVTNIGVLLLIIGVVGRILEW